MRAWLDASGATVLRPGQPPLLGSFDAATGQFAVLPGAPDPAQVKKAMAHVMAPSPMYRERLYRLAP